MEKSLELRIEEADLPKTVYVRREPDGNESFLLVDETEVDAADKDDERIIGVYELKEIRSIKMEAVSKKVP